MVSRFILAVVAGALVPLALAPFDIWPLAFVSMGVLFWLAMSGAPRNLAAVGWWYGVGRYAVGVSWVYVSIHEHGHASPALSVVMVALFVAGLALFPGVAAWAYARFVRSGNALADALGFGALWVALEWVLTWVLTGFPWLLLGYSQIDTVLRHWAPVGGVLSLSLIVALGGAAIVVAISDDRRRWQAVGLLTGPWIVAAGLALPRWVAPVASGSVALVQGSIPQEIKWQRESVEPILERYRSLSAPHWQRDLVIWPEAAITLFAHQAGTFLEEMTARARDGGSTLVAGIPAYELDPVSGEGVFRNTAIAAGHGEGRYVKRRLVPFGEYVPLESLLRGVIEFFDLPMSHARAGERHQPLLQAGDWQIAMAICYEVIYPELVRVLARDADLIVTISNDAWFGDSIGPLQHMQMARMRALENGRYVLRGTNNGVTAIVAADGTIRARIPQFEPGVLVGNFEVMAGTTPFGRFGHLPVLAVVLVLLFLPAFMGRPGKDT